MTKKLSFAGDKTWIVINTQDLDQADVHQELEAIDQEIIEYALDKDEYAHMDYNKENHSLTLIFNTIIPNRKDDHYETTPITLIAQEKCLITLVNDNNQYLIPIMAKYIRQNRQVSVYTFLFACLEIISEQYFPITDKIDKERDQLNTKLRQQTSKKNLLALSDLETGNVYLLYAANQNTLLINQLKKHTIYHYLSAEEKEQLDDAHIEAKQLLSMTKLNSEIMEQLSASYNNVLNNNLNDNLTNLNIISILLAIMAVITGFYGMNVALPFMDQPNAWIYISIFGLIIWTLLYYYYKNRFK